jgi:hypothetical protein
MKSRKAVNDNSKKGGQGCLGAPRGAEKESGEK